MTEISDAQQSPPVSARMTGAAGGSQPRGEIAGGGWRLGLLVALTVGFGLLAGRGWLLIIAALTVMIFLHELGHYLTAKWSGMKVTEFFLFFGPKLWSFRRGDTEYSIGALPLGGYVKMAGENPEDTRTGSSDEFLSKTKWQRFQILIMGPVMNLALAVVLMAVVLMQGAQVPSYQDKPVVIGKVEAGSAGNAAGLRAGDVIVAVNDDAVPTWDRFLLTIGTKAEREAERTGKANPSGSAGKKDAKDAKDRKDAKDEAAGEDERPVITVVEVAPDEEPLSTDRAVPRARER